MPPVVVARRSGASSAAATRWGGVLVGRVLSVDCGVATLLTERGTLRAGYGGQLLDLIASCVNSTPCPGDWVEVRDWPDRCCTVERVLPRRTTLASSVARGRTRPALGANIDAVAVVTAANRPDRQGVVRGASWAMDTGLPALVVLTRCDLVGDVAPLADEVAADTRCAVMCTSAVTRVGIAELRRLTEDDRTLALLSPPGHGLTSLVSALVGADRLAVRPERGWLQPLAGGGAVVVAAPPRFP